MSVSICSLAQELEKEFKNDLIEITDKIENVAGKSEAFLDYTELVEELKILKENPLNLNAATCEDLRELPFLNELQIFELLTYRESYGQFRSLYELQSIDCFDQKTIEQVLPFIQVSEYKEREPLSLKTIAKNAKSKFIMKYQKILQEQSGYIQMPDSILINSPNKYYLGNPDRYYFRYGMNYFDKVRLGLTLEKDPGEPFVVTGINDSIKSLSGNKLRSGFDFYSFHFLLKDWGVIKTLAIGDYQLQFGQGLTLWSGLAFGKSADVTNIKKHGKGVKAYTSTNENSYFRGIAAMLKLNKFHLSLFYSSNGIDANLTSADTNLGNRKHILSLPETGLHRTPDEISDKNSTNIMICGGHISYIQSRFKFGLTTYATVLKDHLLKNPVLYNYFGISGRKFFNLGFDYNYLFQKFNFFGEVSVSDNGGIAQLHGINAILHPNMNLTFSYRNYKPMYINLFNNGFGEAGQNINEYGFYAGIRLQLPAKLTLSVYADNYVFPWLKYRINAPSSGIDILVQLYYIHTKTVFMYFRWKQKGKQINSTLTESYIDPVVNSRKNNFRFHIGYSVSPTIDMKNRLEYLCNRTGSYYRRSGYLIYHDIIWKDNSGKFSSTVRYALFDTDSYAERIYAYENDVLYAYSVLPYYFSGSRGVVLFKYKPSRVLQLWIRFSHNWLKGQDTIGSGSDEIKGNKKSEIKLQLMMKL